MADNINTEAIQGALKAVKIIRCSVRDLFKLLSEGTNLVAPPPQTAENGAVVVAAANAETPEKQFMTDLQTIINNLNTRIRELESSCTLLAHSSSQLSLGNSALLGQDPAFERSLIYSSMVTSYRWCDKMLEYASHAHAILQQQSLKRSNFNSLTNNAIGRSRFGAPLMFPRRSIGHNVPVQQVDNICHMMQRHFPDMNIELLRPFGTAAVVKITLERVLKAVILLRGLIIEWIMVKGFHEDFEGDGKTSIDIWSESRYEVFKKVTNHANAAMLHFYSAIHPDLAVTSYLKWLHSYSSLFSKPCRKCECRLQDSLPPTWRDLRTLDAYHELCRP
ncbi:cofactor required for Sp1 transcriptional activation-like protein [Leptotrombidium deliense]|uniref:Cofactor required for Sp1 transcriptional activation-like protein n=1 Tax=Leptotrombidium deliense TaxID=299467 RepID=A0A443SWT9_9ACAR|nr:cofactor required for Sp1 transcriptional activation-like protein [Leptotrombidium deliense]